MKWIKFDNSQDFYMKDPFDSSGMSARNIIAWHPNWINENDGEDGVRFGFIGDDGKFHTTIYRPVETEGEYQYCNEIIDELPEYYYFAEPPPINDEI